VTAAKQAVILDIEGRRVEVSPKRAGSIRRAQRGEADVVIIAVLAAHAHLLSAPGGPA